MEKASQTNESDKKAMSLSGLISVEKETSASGQELPVLNGVSFFVDKGDVVGISGADKRAVLVLIEILGNMRPYFKGYARITSFGTHSKKHSVLEEIFYTDSPDMLYGRMTLLEHLLFATRRLDKCADAEQRRTNMYAMLKGIGLGQIADKRLHELSAAQQMNATILIGALTDSVTVVANLLNHRYELSEMSELACVASYVKKIGKTLVIASMQPQLIGIACKSVCYLLDGKAAYCGSVDKLCEKWDKVVCIIKNSDLKTVRALIETQIRNVSCQELGNWVIVRGNGEHRNESATEIFQLFNAKGISTDRIKFNKGRVGNAFEELADKYGG